MRITFDLSGCGTDEPIAMPTFDDADAIGWPFGQSRSFAPHPSGGSRRGPRSLRIRAAMRP